jgi:hypothetical protein
MAQYRHRVIRVVIETASHKRFEDFERERAVEISTAADRGAAKTVFVEGQNLHIAHMSVDDIDVDIFLEDSMADTSEG